MIKIAVCDDEMIICSEIVTILKSLHKNFDIYEFHNGDELIEGFIDFEIIILDIEMPGENGMKIAEKIQQNSIDAYIIFLTSHTEFIHDAFKVKAFRYLNKPIVIEDFMEAVIAAEKEILNTKTITLKMKDTAAQIKLADILYLEAFGDGTYVYTVNGVYESSKHLNYILGQLESDSFFQSHKSFAVSFDHIKSISKFEIEIIGEKVKIPISRRKTAELNKKYFDYIKNNSTII